MNKIKNLNKTRTKILFLNFLKKEKILDEFNEEFYKSNWNRGCVSIVHYLNLWNFDFIIHAFQWNKTSKGYYFWQDMNKKWLSTFNKKYEQD